MKDVTTTCLLVLLSTVISFTTAVPWDSFRVLKSPPSTVDKLDVAKYVGRWYQMYANKFVFATFERNNLCVTADYGLNADGTISVFNAARLRKPDGELTTINGTATIPDPKEPGKLSVTFDSIPSPGGAPYWVLKLGPVEGAVSEYQYAIVSDSQRLSLFVLARNTDDFKARFEQEVLAFLADNGFTGFLNKPVNTYQEADCKYAPLSQIKAAASRQLSGQNSLWKYIFNAQGRK